MNYLKTADFVRNLTKQIYVSLKFQSRAANILWFPTFFCKFNTQEKLLLKASSMKSQFLWIFHRNISTTRTIIHINFHRCSKGYNLNCWQTSMVKWALPKMIRRVECGHGEHKQHRILQNHLIISNIKHSLSKKKKKRNEMKTSKR